MPIRVSALRGLGAYANVFAIESFIAEYFPDPLVSGFHDPRQHAVSLAYVVPVDGECRPSAESLDLAWVTPTEAASREVRDEMTGGHDRLLRLALAHVGALP